MNRYLKSPLVWVIGIIIILGLWFMGNYNRFVSLSGQIDGQWAQVEVQYQRRFDLIPNLVSAVKGIFKQEQSVFSEISEARTRYAGTSDVNAKVGAANQLEGALGRLLVIMENYPQLRSAENVTQLMDELAGTENRVAVERKRYNDLVRDYNIAIARFPGNTFASLFGFQARALFESVEGAEQTPKVEF